MTLQPPIRGSIRFASAFLGTIIFALGISQVLWPDRGSGIGFFFLGWGALMWLPVFAQQATRRNRVEEKWRRVVVPALLFITLGFITNGMSWLIDRGYFAISNGRNVAREISSIGSAMWLVGFILLLFAVYYSSQLRQQERESKSDDGAG